MVPFIINSFYRWGNRLSEVKWLAQDHITSKLRTLDPHLALGLQGPGADSPERTGLDRPRPAFKTLLWYVVKVMWHPHPPYNCKQNSRVHFHLHHANFQEYSSTLIPDHGPLNPALQGHVSLFSSKRSWSLSAKEEIPSFFPATTCPQTNLQKVPVSFPLLKFDWLEDVPRRPSL